MIHIANDDTFFIKAPKFDAKCWICGVVCEQEFGWIGTRCSVCGSVSDTEMGFNGLVRRRRQLLGLSRKQMAQQTGLKTSTIKKYEWVWPSTKYLNLTIQLMDKLKKLQKQVDDFNAKHKVGDTMQVTKSLANKEYFDVTIKYPASILGGHSAVAWFKELSSCYGLEFVREKPAMQDEKIH